MTTLRRATRVALLALALTSTTAVAHITLETRSAPADSSYKAVLRVGHGCEGSPTVAVRVRIPEGVVAVKPMPKPGWELTTVVEPFVQPVAYFETTLTEGVREIAWRGGPLPDAWYDEFVFRAKLPNLPEGTVLWFPVVQECEKGVHRWIAIPREGEPEPKEPAPGVKLLPKQP